MTPSRLYLFGPPRLEVKGQPASIDRRKSMALLAYLALTPRAQARDSLAALFWPEYGQKTARSNLRQALYVLNQALEGNGLNIEREQVALQGAEALWVDVAQFRDLLDTCEHHPHAPSQVCSACLPLLAKAVRLYQDDFLAGFTLPDCAEFDDWQLFETESLRRALAGALARLAQGHAQQGEFKTGLVYAHRWLALDPLHEPAQRGLMQLYAEASDRAAALRQYQECTRLLREELGLSPSEETSQLYEAIKAEQGSRGAREQESIEFFSSAPPLPRLPAPPQEEIRLVTVLFVHIHPSAEPTWHLPPEAAADLIKPLFESIETILQKFSARIDRFSSDGLVAVFGAPQAHEDDPERALRAALEIRQAVRGLGWEVTMGINTGPVYFGRIGAEGRQEVTALGPTVNLAARLQHQAGPGHILAGEATYRQTHRAFKFTPLLFPVEGLPHPVRAYQLFRPRRRAEKSRGLETLQAELIGRDEELAKLKAILAQVEQGQGQMISLIAEAGVGKSRLVAELKYALLNNLQSQDSSLKSKIQNRKSKILWLEGRCLEMSMAAGYRPLIDMLQGYLAWGPEDDEASRANRLVTSLQALVAKGSLSVEQFEEMGPLLGHLLVLHFGNDWDERLKFAGPEQLRHQTLLALRDFLVALARSQPVVLLFEDLHWADDLSLDLLSLLMETLPTTSLLLLCLYRPERQHRCWQLATLASRKCPAHFTELRLRDLTPPQSRQLVQALLAMDDLPASLQALILERTQGNPFFVEEVIRSLIDSGFLYQVGEAWRVQPEFEATALPETIQSVILSRVDRLKPELRQALQAAAVMGRLFRRRVLAEALSTGVDLDEILPALEAQALIYQERAAPEVEYSFKHVLTQEAIYQTLLRRPRANLHRQVAEALEQLYSEGLEAYYEQLAYHYDRSEAIEKAVEYLLKAGEKSRRAYLNDEALTYFQKALAHLDALEAKWKIQTSSQNSSLGKSKIECLKGLGQMSFSLGQLVQAESYFRQAIALGQETEMPARELARLYYWLGETMFWQGQQDGITRAGESGLALLGDEIESVEAVSLMMQVAGKDLGVKAWVKSFRIFTAQVTPFIDRLPYAEELRPVYLWIAVTYAFYDKKGEVGLEWLQRLQQRARQHHDLTALEDSYFDIGNILMAQGNHREAIAKFQQALDLSARTRKHMDTTKGLLFLGLAHLTLGELSQAEQALSDSLHSATATEPTSSLMLPYIHENFGLIFLGQGLWKLAVEALQQAAQPLPGGLLWDQVRVLVALGWCFLAQSKGLEAGEYFHEAITLMEPDYLSSPYPADYTQRSLLVSALSGLEAAYSNPAEFHTFCHHYWAEHPQVEEVGLKQWYLEAEEPDFGFRILDFGLERENLKAKIKSLRWYDSFGDCSFHIGDELEIHAANGRDLWHINRGAPRLLRPVEGDFAVQTVCEPVSAEKPAIGGILLWKDEENYLRLDLGIRGEAEISLESCLDNKDIVIGRGRLWGVDNKTSEVSETSEVSITTQVHLRLERAGRQVKALCSADGQTWFRVGQVEFPIEDPVEVGLHAIGLIDRSIYHDTFPEGTAIRFEGFWVWR